MFYLAYCSRYHCNIILSPCLSFDLSIPTRGFPSRVGAKSRRNGDSSLPLTTQLPRSHKVRKLGTRHELLLAPTKETRPCIALVCMLRTGRRELEEESKQRLESRINSRLPLHENISWRKWRFLITRSAKACIIIAALFRLL